MSWSVLDFFLQSTKLDLNFALWPAYFLREFVTKRWTSWRSSNSNIAPKYPILLSVNLCDAINFRHSSYKQNRLQIYFNFFNSTFTVTFIIFWNNIPDQNVLDNQACECRATLLHFYIGRCCLLLGKYPWSVHIPYSPQLFHLQLFEPIWFRESNLLVASELAWQGVLSTKLRFILKDPNNIWKIKWKCPRFIPNSTWREH